MKKYKKRLVKIKDGWIIEKIAIEFKLKKPNLLLVQRGEGVVNVCLYEGVSNY